MSAAHTPTGPTTAELLDKAERYADSFTPVPGGAKVAVVACMDNRLDVTRLLGLENGDAYVIRNAGGVITEDVLRSLAISQRLLGTREIVLIHHTDCGMLSFKDAEFRDSIESETGSRPEWSSRDFADLDADVRDSLARVAADPYLSHKDSVRGFVFDVATGELREVETV